MFNTSNNNTTITNNFSSSEDKIIEQRRFMYQKAIEAYQYHVNRYHTWMNYYSIFTGALFVGFYYLTTATTEIKLEKINSAINQCCCSIEDTCKIYKLTNDYFLLIITLCILGLISSICWLLSLYGHEKWERNWMQNIEYYEDAIDDKDGEKYESFILYKIINGDKKDFKAFSTHTITKIFIMSVILGWYFCIALTICKEYNCISCFLIIIFLVIAVIAMCKFKRLYSDIISNLYSDITSKISRINK